MNAFAEPEPTPALVADINNLLDNLDTDELAYDIHQHAPNDGLSFRALAAFYPHLDFTEGDAA